MSGRAPHAARALLALALGYVVLVAASCPGSDPAGPGDTERVHVGLVVNAELDVVGLPIVSHPVAFSTWKTNDMGESIQGTDMHFNRSTNDAGWAAAYFGYELLFDTESNTFKEFVRCRVFATYGEETKQADAYFMQGDLAAGDTVKTVTMSW